MKRLLVIIPIIISFLFAAGCSIKSLNLESPVSTHKLTFDADEFIFYNQSPVEDTELKTIFAKDADIIFFSKEVQKQFHDHIRNVIEEMVRLSASGNGKKTSIKIDKAILFIKLSTGDLIPVINIFAGFLDKRYVALIEGVIEIRDKKCEIIARKPFRIESLIKEKINTNSQMEEGGSKAANLALILLQNELIKQGEF